MAAFLGLKTGVMFLEQRSERQKRIYSFSTSGAVGVVLSRPRSSAAARLSTATSSRQSLNYFALTAHA
jgi:hypothetical protein